MIIPVLDPPVLPMGTRDPRDPDPVVFGPRGSGGLQGLHPAGLFGSFRRCGVGWRGDGPCWCCGGLKPREKEAT